MPRLHSDAEPSPSLFSSRCPAAVATGKVRRYTARCRVSSRSVGTSSGPPPCCGSCYHYDIPSSCVASPRGCWALSANTRDSPLRLLLSYWFAVAGEDCARKSQQLWETRGVSQVRVIYKSCGRSVHACVYCARFALSSTPSNASSVHLILFHIAIYFCYRRWLSNGKHYRALRWHVAIRDKIRCT